MVSCPKCGSEMRHLYSEDKIEAQIKDIKNPMVKLNMEFEMRREFICLNQRECSYIHRLSKIEIVKEFAKSRREKGESVKEILNEVDDKIKEVRGENA